jgi:hypothetical protein
MKGDGIKKREWEARWRFMLGTCIEVIDNRES